MKWQRFWTYPITALPAADKAGAHGSWLAETVCILIAFRWTCQTHPSWKQKTLLCNLVRFLADSRRPCKVGKIVACGQYTALFSFWPSGSVETPECCGCETTRRGYARYYCGIFPAWCAQRRRQRSSPTRSTKSTGLLGCESARCPRCLIGDWRKEAQLVLEARAPPPTWR